MAIGIEVCTATAIGNGVQTTFNYGFFIDDQDNAELYLLGTDGVITGPIASNLWSMTGVGAATGGTFTYPLSGSPIANGVSITLLRTMPYLQPVTLQNQGAYYPLVVESMGNYPVYQTQQLYEIAQRSIRVPAAGGDVLSDLPSADLRALKAIVFDANGDVSVSVDDYVDQVAIVTAAAAAAAASAAAAAASETAAETAATNAETAETGAENAQAAAVAAQAAAEAAQTAAETAETNAETAETNAEAAATAAQNYAEALWGTSTTSLAIGTGAKVFTTQADKQWTAGQRLQATSDADPSDFLNGTVTSYSATTLTLDVDLAGGSGTHADWTINITGEQGEPGEQGEQGDPGTPGTPGAPGLEWRGAWDIGTAYVESDGVSNDGSSYICILANTGEEPPNGTYWNLLAQEGATGPGGGDVIGPASSTSGNIASFGSGTGKLIADSGVAAASVVVGPASATSQRVAVFNGGTGKLLQDGTKLESDLVVGPASSTSGRVAVFNGTGGKTLQDGTKLETDLVTGPASSTSGRVAVFNGTGGKTLQDGTKLETDLATGPASAVSGNFPSFNGTGGKALQDSGLAEGTSAQYRANTADKLLSTDQVWGAMAEVALTDAATIAWDMSTGLDFSFTFVSNSRTMGNPTNTKVGQKGRLRLVQNAGSHTITWSGNFEFAGGVAPTISTGAADEDVLYYDVISSTRILIAVGALDIS